MAVCRDERGNYLGSSALVIEGMQDIAILECMACREALSLAEQSCLLKITWPKKVIPTKSYSLSMLYLHHTKYLNHAQPQF